MSTRPSNAPHAGGASYGADNQLAPLWHDELAPVDCHCLPTHPTETESRKRDDNDDRYRPTFRKYTTTISVQCNA